MTNTELNIGQKAEQISSVKMYRVAQNAGWPWGREQISLIGRQWYVYQAFTYEDMFC